MTEPASAAVNEHTNEAPSFDASLVVRQPRHVIARAGLVAVILGFIGVYTLPVAFLMAAELAILLGVVASSVAAQTPRIRERSIKANRAGLTVGNEHFPRASIKTALVRHEGHAKYARFEMQRGRRVDVRMKTEDEAKRMFAALGMDAMSSTVELLLMSTSRLPLLVIALPVMAAVFWMGQSGAAPYTNVPGILAITAAILLGSRLRAVKMWVGADGIRVKEALRKPVFYKHSDILDVSSDRTRVKVILKDGGTKRWDAVAVRNPKEEHIEQARSIVRRIRDARAANASLEAIPFDAQVLVRGSRTPREWVDALKRLGDGALAGFREAATSRESLLAIVESTRASAVERLAAALALKPSLTVEEAPRIRIAAERCALPELSQRLRVVVDSQSQEEAEAALIEAEAAESPSSSTPSSASSSARSRVS